MYFRQRLSSIALGSIEELKKQLPMEDRLKLYSELQKTLWQYRNKKNKSYKNDYLENKTSWKKVCIF